MASWSIISEDGGIATIDESTGLATFEPNSSNTVKHFTVTYTSDNGTTCTMPVTQQGNVCSFTYRESDGNVPLTGKTGYVFGTLSNIDGQTITVSLDSGSDYVDNFGVTDDYRVIGDVANNDNGDPNIDSRDIDYTILANGVECASYSKKQEGKTCTCECTDLSVSENSLSWLYNEGETVNKKFKIASGCTTDVTIDKSGAGWFTVSDMDSEGYVTVHPQGENDTQGTKSGHVVIKFKACGKSCDAQFEKTINFTQLAYVCECNNIIFGGDPEPWEWNKYTISAKAEVSISDERNCITDITVNQSEHFTAAINGERTNVIVYPRGENTLLEPIRESVTVTYTVGDTPDCKHVINLVQGSYECVCGSVIFGDNPSDWEWNEMSDSVKKYVTVSDASGCIRGITVGASDGFNAYMNDDNTKVYVYPTSINTYRTPLEGTAIVSYTAGTNTNCIREIPLRQNSDVCKCVKLSIPNNTVGFDENIYEIGTYSIICAGDFNVELYSSDGQFDYGVLENGIVKVALHSTTEAHSVKFGIMVNGVECGEIYVIKRICPCPVDNCWTADVYEHPMHVDYAYVDYAPAPYGRAASPHTGDSILIPVGKIRYPGTVLRGGTMSKVDHYPVKEGATALTNVTLEIGDLITDAGNGNVSIVIQDNGASCPTFEYYVKQNTTNQSKDYEIFFDVILDDGSVTIDEHCLCASKPTEEERAECFAEKSDWRQDQIPCDDFKVILRQASNGKKYIRKCIDTLSNDSTWIEVPYYYFCPYTGDMDCRDLHMVIDGDMITYNASIEIAPGTVFGKTVTAHSYIPEPESNKAYGLGELNLNGNVTRVDGTFSNNANLTTINLPRTVISIAGDAFTNCTNLNSIIFNSEDVPILESNTAFGNNSAYRKIYVPASKVDVYKAAWPTYASVIEANPVTYENS